MIADRIIFPLQGEIAFEKISLPSLSPHEIQVETLYSVISPGTELAFLRALPNTSATYPFYPGYTACARVSAIGRDVKEFKEGQIVAAWMPHASAAVIDAKLCWPIPPHLSANEASAFRLLSIALQGVRKAQIQLGQSVAVFGLGVIGNLAGQVARNAGATHVVGIDPVVWRRDIALQCGFDATLNSSDISDSLNPPEEFDVVIDATGLPEVIPQAFALTARMGRTVLLGSTRGITGGVNFYRDVHKKGLTVIGAHESIRANSEDFGHLATHHSDGRTALQLMVAKRVATLPLLSLELPASQAKEAYSRLMDKTEKLLSVVLKWQ
ncbi:MAG: zinc-binding alcohol dehydrogenase [Chthoniobacterales bacterium]